MPYALQYLKGLKQEMQAELPFLAELMADLSTKVYYL